MLSSPVAQLLATLLLGWWVLKCEAQVSLGCYADQPDEPAFVVSADGYNPALMNPSACAYSCQTIGYQYAGIEEGQFCLCSNTITSMTAVDERNCQSPCSGNSTGSSGWCGGLDAFISVYQSGGGGDFSGSLSGVTLTVTPATVIVAQEVTFTVSIEMGSNVQFKMFYGDGASASVGNASGIFTHIYTLPGIYQATVYASDAINPQNTVYSSVIINVNEIFNQLLIDCPTVENPYTVFNCTVTMVTGPTCAMTVDPGDGTPALKFTAIETRYDPIGTPVPQVEVPNMQNVSLGPIIVLGGGSAIDTEAYLTAIEAYLTQPGLINLLILQPACSSGQFCYGSQQCENTCPVNSNQVTCQSTDVYRPSTRSCASSGSSVSQTSYTQRTSYSIPTLNAVGYMYLDLQSISSTIIPLFPGDVLAFQTTGDATVAHRNADTTEMPDLVTNTVEGQWTISSAVHYFRAIITKPSLITLQVSYNTTKNYTYDVTCVNENGASITNSTTIAIINGIGEINVTASQLYIPNKSLVTLTVTVINGSNFEILWDFGDGKSVTANEQGSVTIQSYNVSHQYDTEGTYHVTVNVHNVLDNKSDSVDIQVLFPVSSGWTFSSNTPQLCPPCGLSLTLRLAAPARLPSMATAQFIWDSEESQQPTNISLPNGTISSDLLIPVNHTYMTSGVYFVTVIISNAVSNFTVTTNVTVIETIDGLSVNLQYMSPGQGNSPKPARGPNQDTVVTNSNVTIEVTSLSGSITGYMLYASNGTWILNSSINIFYYQVHQTGTYNLTVYAWNEVQGRSDPFDFVIVSEEVSSGLEITDFYINTNYNESKIFEIVFGSLTADSCVLVSFNDSKPTTDSRDEDYYDETSNTNTDFYAYGFIDTCLLNYTEYYLDFLGPAANPMNISHVFASKGVYYINVVVFNQMSVANTSLIFTVTDFPCPKPTVTLNDRRDTVATAAEFKRSTGVRMSAVANINCTKTISTKKQWSVYLVDNRFGLELEAIDVSSIESSTKSVLYLSSLFLPYGYYKLVYVLSITVDGMDPQFPWVRSVFTYIQIVPTDLVAVMVPGSISSVLRGSGQYVDLNPQMNSVDPDQPDDHTFNVTWLCRRVKPDNETLATDTNGDYELSNVVQVPTIDSSKPTVDNGGCFGTGAGAVSIDDGSWLLNTALFYSSSMTYEVIAVISKDTRQAIVKIAIEVVDGNPPAVNIKCENTLLCFPFSNGLLINSGTRLGVYGDCDQGCDEPLTYWWNLFLTDDVTVAPDVDDYMAGNNANQMAINGGYFGNTSSIHQFHLHLEVTSMMGVGRSMLYLLINQPPTGGTCNMSPQTGKALLDTFQLNCVGFTDPENQQIQSYSFFVQISNSVAINVLATSSASKQDVVLPYGDLSIWATIKDDYGASVTVYIATRLELNLPTIDEYQNYMNSSAISNLVGGGQQELISQVLLAASSIQATGLLNPPMITNDNGTQVPDVAAQNQQQIQNSQTISGYLDVLSNLTASGGLNDLEMVAGTLASVVSNGSNLDAGSKQKTVDLLSQLGQHLQNLTLASPQEMRTMVGGLVSGMSAVTSATGNVVLKNQTLPADMAKAYNMDYDSNVDPNVGDPDIPLTLDDMYVSAIKTDAIYSSRKQSEAMMDIVHNFGNCIRNSLAPNEEPISVNTNGAAAIFAKLVGSNTSKLAVTLGESSVVFPTFCSLFGLVDCDDNVTVSFQAIEWSGPPQTFGRDIGRLASNTKAIQIEIYDDNNQLMDIQNMSHPIDIYISRTTDNGTSVLPDPTPINVTLKWNEFMMYHQFSVTNPESSVNILLTVDDPNTNFVLFVSFQKKPTILNYDIAIKLSNISLINSTWNTFNWFISSHDVGNRTGYFYLGVAEMNVTTADINNLTYNDLTQNFTSQYSLLIFTSGCYFYSKLFNRWIGDGCRVAAADPFMTHCKCTHLTTFGSGFFIAPNSINFDYVFANASFNDNLTIYVTIIITFVICVMILIYARWKDRKDLSKLGAAPLPDNVHDDKYLYEILVFTGSNKNSATDSQVYFILSGDDDETEVRHFGDDQRKIFQRSGVDVFIMSVPRSLGSLNYMRIWHDNSGVGENSSWHLNYIVIRDVQTGDKFEFISNSWFALEHGDGAIDRLLPVAGREQQTEFNHLMSNTTHRELADGHLWFSIFLRPPRSRFTRVQRVGCCMAFLYLSMLVNAMWYGTTNSGPSANAFKLGPFAISTEQIGVGLISNLIVFPPNFIIVLLFRKARPRKLRVSRIKEALRRQNSKKVSESKEQLTQHDALEKQHEEDSAKSPPIKWHRKKRCTLPWMFQGVAWVLVIACIGASIFFLWAYGITFGNDKTKKWVTSLVVSFFASVLITEPIKLFLMAMFLSAICKSTDMDSDDADEDEEDPALLADENYLHNAHGRERKSRYFPPDPQALTQARTQRMKEIQMWSVLKEIMRYLLFLLVLVVVSYGNRDPNAFYFKTTLQRSFIRTGLSNDFNNVGSSDDFWNWAEAVLVPRLRAQRLYNDRPPFGFKGFLQDQVNRLMGYAIIRQIRIKKGLCYVPEVMRVVTTNCSGTYSSVIDEDETSYNKSWRPLRQTSKEEVLTDVDRAFRYQTAKQLDGYPTVGDIDVYSGGGYVIPLQGRQSDLIQSLEQLRALNWIDRYTRSVNVEFSVFNAQVNLFGVCSIKIEMIPGGGLFPSYRFDGIRLLEYHTGFGLVIMLCEIVFALFVLYFTVHETIEICKLKRKWCQSYWNYAEVLIVMLSLAIIVVYAFRYIHTDYILDRFNQTKGNAYVNLQYVYTLDQIFGSLLAIVVFVATLKFIKLLRFNRRMGVLSSTLAHAWGDLLVFGLCFFIVFLAFVQLFYLLMSANSSDFGTFVRTVEYTFSMMLQKFEFSQIEAACPVLGAVAFFIFSLMTSIVLVNLLLTIIIRSFEDVSKDIFKQPNDYEIVDFILKRFTTFVGLGGQNAAATGGLKLFSSTDGQSQDGNSNVTHLSDNVDKLVQKINNAYFNGKIDLNSLRKRGSRKAIVSS